MKGWCSLPRAVAVLLLLATVTLPDFAFAAQRGGAPLLGAYLWDGHLHGDRTPAGFRKSIEFLLNKGFTAIRFAVTPEALSTYGIDEAACRGGEFAQGCYLRMMLDGPEADDSRLKLLMITLHSFATPIERNLAERDIDKYRLVLEQELAASIEVLNRRFKGSTVRIVISNWEGDNLIFCGQSWSFATQVAFRAACKANGPSIIERQRSFVRLMGMRDAGVKKARSSSALNIAHAPEINMATSLRDTCGTQCSEDETVIERFTSKQTLCSYSAYDTANLRQMARGLNALTKRCGRLIIGELGFSVNLLGAERVRQLYASGAAAVGRNAELIDAIFFWNAFDDTKTRVPGFGLFSESGASKNVNLLPYSWRSSTELNSR